MTGFGQASAEVDGLKITVEVRSLNSKGLDLNMRMPQVYRSMEADLRQLASQELERGKVDLNINRELTDTSAEALLNKPLLMAYIRELKAVASSQAIEGDILGAAMRMPDVLGGGKDEVAEAERALLLKLAADAMRALQEHRIREGKALEADFKARIQLIGEKQNLLTPFETERIKGLRERFNRQLEKLDVAHDANRLEQEIIFYLEKLDITEEQVRLKHHLDFFLETAAQAANAGRKLGFIAQEMGREINTIGSKSNHSGMQRLVVEMKDELEKIKEQVNNVLCAGKESSLFFQPPPAPGKPPWCGNCSTLFRSWRFPSRPPAGYPAGPRCTGWTTTSSARRSLPAARPPVIFWNGKRCIPARLTEPCAQRCNACGMPARM